MVHSTRSPFGVFAKFQRRALMNDRDLILVDELTSSLDSTRGRKIVSSLIEEVKSRNKLGIMVTHDLSMAEMADRTLEPHDGTLSQSA